MKSWCVPPKSSVATGLETFQGQLLFMIIALLLAVALWKRYGVAMEASRKSVNLSDGGGSGPVLTASLRAGGRWVQKKQEKPYGIYEQPEWTRSSRQEDTQVRSSPFNAPVKTAASLFGNSSLGNLHFREQCTFGNCCGPALPGTTHSGTTLSVTINALSRTKIFSAVTCGNLIGFRET